MLTARQEAKDALIEKHGNIRTLDGFAIDLLGDDPTSNVRWHQIGIEGEWSGHWMGAFSLDERMFDEMVLHLASKKNDTVVDYEHESVFGSGSDSAAAGWVTELQIRDDDGGKALFARIEWNARAAKHIREKEFKYLSPTFIFHTRDRKSGELTGASLHSVALTNTPFLDELPEVRLNSIRAAISGGSPSPKQEQREMDDKKKAALCALLGLSADATPEQMIDTARAQSGDVQALEHICSALNLETGSDGAAILTTVRVLKAQSMKVGELEAEMAPLREQAAKVAKIEAERRVEKSRTAGQIVATNEAWAVALAEKDPAGFDAWAAAAPKVVPTTAKVPPNGDVRASTGEPTEEQIKALVASLPEDDLKTCKMSNLSPEMYVRANYAELSAA